jgi:hypothetical protein
LYLSGAARRGGGGGEVGIPGAARKNDDAALFQVTDGATLDVGLRQLFHLDGRLHARIDAGVLERTLERERVDHRGQHAHVVGSDAVDETVFRDGAAADDIAAADDDADLGPHRLDVGNLLAERGKLREVDATPVLTGEDFTAELEQDSPEAGTAQKRPPTGRAGNARSARP